MIREKLEQLDTSDFETTEVTFKWIESKNDIYHLSNISVSEHQDEFVSDSVISLGEAYIKPESHVPFLITNKDEFIGFIMLQDDYYTYQKNAYTLRIMIDEAHQQQGYGSSSMALALDIFKKIKAEKVVLSVVANNSKALSIYENMGFRDTKQVDKDGDLIYELEFRKEEVCEK